MSLQEEKKQLTQEALALYAMDFLLPPVLRAAAERREFLSRESEKLAASLPEPLAEVVGEEAIQEEALGPLPEDPHEPTLRQLKRMLKQQNEGVKVLQAWLEAHPSPDRAKSQKRSGGITNRLSLVGALRAPEAQPEEPIQEVSAPPTGAAFAALEEREKLSQQLLTALDVLRAFASEHALLPSPFPHKRSSEGSPGKQLQTKGSPHLAPTLFSVLKELPRAEPVEAFVKAFKRYAAIQCRCCSFLSFASGLSLSALSPSASLPLLSDAQRGETAGGPLRGGSRGGTECSFEPFERGCWAPCFAGRYGEQGRNTSSHCSVRPAEAPYLSSGGIKSNHDRDPSVSADISSCRYFHCPTSELAAEGISRERCEGAGPPFTGGRRVPKRCVPASLAVSWLKGSAIFWGFVCCDIFAGCLS